MDSDLRGLIEAFVCASITQKEAAKAVEEAEDNLRSAERAVKEARTELLDETFWSDSIAPRIFQSQDGVHAVVVDGESIKMATIE